MAGVWGKGGLFEQAVQQKYANQGMNAATDRMNAETNRFRAGNDLMLGTRGADTNQMNAQTNLLRTNNDFSLGLRGADTDRMNAGTNQFDAQTNRLRVGNDYSLGLRSADTQQYEAETNRGTLASNLLNPDGTTPALGTSYMREDLRRAPSDNTDDKPAGFRNGGVFLKPRMVRQPGYKNSGKVRAYGYGGKVMAYGDGGKVIPDANSAIREEISKLAAEGDVDGATALLQKLQQMEASQGNPVKGYGYGGKVMGYENGGLRGGPDFPKSQGPIGNAEADMGQDEVDAVVRPGEYLLNPDTVAAFGKLDPKTVNAVFKPVGKAIDLAEYSSGDYDRGVRNLNKIARNVTGREPGPKEMEGGSAVGFADSGAADPDEAFWRRRSYEQMADAQAREQVNRATGGSTVYVDSKGNASTEVPKNSYQAAADYDVGQGVRRGATRVAQTVKRLAPSAETTGKILNVGGKVLAPVGVAFDAADVVDVATDPNMTKGDVANEIAGKVGKWGLTTAGAFAGGAKGAAIGSVFGPPGIAIGGALGGIGGGLAGYLGADALIEGGRALTGTDRRDPSERSNGIVTQLLSGESAAPPPPAPSQKEAAAAAARSNGVRDMPAAEPVQVEEPVDPTLEMLKNLSNRKTGLVSVKTMENLQNYARDKYANELTARANAATAALQGREYDRKLRKNVYDQLSERFVMPKYNDDGNLVGYEKSPAKLNEFINYTSQLRDGNGEFIDFATQPPIVQDMLIREFETNQRGLERFNNRVTDQSGGRISTLPRIGENSLRNAGEITMGDIGDRNISLRDWLRSWGSNELEDTKLYDPVTKQYVSAVHALLNKDGSIDQDLVEQLNLNLGRANK